MIRRGALVALGVIALVLAARRLSRVANSGPGGIGEFLAQVQEAAAEREVELRAGLGLDGRHDVVDGHTVAAPDNRSAAARHVGDNQ